MFLYYTEEKHLKEESKQEVTEFSVLNEIINDFNNSEKKFKVYLKVEAMLYKYFIITKAIRLLKVICDLAFSG